MSHSDVSVILRQKKHWIAVHTFISEEARLERAKSVPPTDRQFFDAYSTDRAECIQHWAGKADFFYCHWLAYEERDIHAAIEAIGMDKFIITMPTEMQRYVSKDNLTDTPLLNPWNE